MNPQENEVFINGNGLIETIFIGDQTEATLLEVRKQYEILIGQLKSENKPIRLLIYLDRVTKTDSGARTTAVGILKDLPFEKVGVYGGDIKMRVVAKLIISAVEHFSNIKYFSSREETERWLLE